ncbi:hypothetical protein FTW40_23945 [Escherichia coli]|nr:hypothetical protein [Escherichia coli]EFC3722777.1 hypothetical protein [Escherichia coli]
MVLCVCAVLFVVVCLYVCMFVCLLYNLSLYVVMSLLFMLSILYVCNAYISIHYAVKHMGEAVW